MANKQSIQLYLIWISYDGINKDLKNMTIACRKKQQSSREVH